MSRHVVSIAVSAVALFFVTAPVGVHAAEVDPKAVDASIVSALRYLSREQLGSGAWEIGRLGESTSATSLAIMAFMAAGHVPGEGPYGTQINRGIDWVIAQQQRNGLLVKERSHGPMYSHGISTLMLAEVVGMVDEARAKPVREALERGVKLILEAQGVRKGQQHAGGWRYQPGSDDSDLSVTGWQLLALRAAKGVGCDVPASHIDDAVEYVKACSRAGNGFGYMPGHGSTSTLTGVGILALEICGEHRADETMTGADALLRRPLRMHDRYFFYGVYYCTVGMFKVGGDHWKEAQPELVGVLLDNQQADGSWSAPRQTSEDWTGEIYCTSLAVLALAVEYQYLPIYQR